MIDEIIQVQDEYYILSTSSRVDDRTHVLKGGDTFAVFDRFGDFAPLGRPELGLYHQDTRFLSRLGLRLGADRPLLLSSSVSRDNAFLTVDLANRDVELDGEVLVQRGSVHVYRSMLLWDATCHHRLRLHNYDRSPVELSLRFDFEADFADLFEVRGIKREGRGRLLPPVVASGELEFAYEGLDRRLRRTRITFVPPPAELEADSARYFVRLGPGEDLTCGFAVRCEIEDVPAEASLGAIADRSDGRVTTWEEAARLASTALRSARDEEPVVTTSNRQFNNWLQRSIADLHMMRTDTTYGPYPYAGVPWFSTAFGRDGIITALECLWFNPGIARGVLAYLAATQADDESAERDAQPGKILHETRGGEMSALGEVPFSRYYGSIDATPLFAILAGAYADRTGDLDFIATIWPSILHAMDWIDRHGDVDGDGFVECARRSPRGLVNQGWKDSHDAVFHADGELAEGPIALCEVQGYVYAARRSLAGLAQQLGHYQLAVDLTGNAERMGRRFEEAFWNEELQTYVIALDGQKRQCAVRSSNAGHCLYVGLASEDRARRVAATLLDGTSFSGWGIRTIAAGTPRYNPMSYHNGSIWPHDNALVAAGFARYGLKQETAAVFGGLYDASLFFDLHRLPELFCGFRRRAEESPTHYPVSCSPQTWASAAVFLMLESMLGLTIRGAQQEVIFANPALPEFLKEVHLTGLRVGSSRVDLELTRHEHDVGVNVLRREGRVKVVVVK